MRAPSRRMVLLLTFLAVLAVVMPFLVWHQTWFGRRLSEGEIERYLRDPQRPRKIQHALSQISDRIARNDPAVAGLYPSVVETARHPEHAIRATAAWVMGQDNTSEAFHQALLRLLEDPDLLVRRNAALSLVRFRDGSGRAELVAMLQSHAATAPAGGRPASLEPGANQVWEALRGLYLIGDESDLPHVERYLQQGVPPSDLIQRQAAYTAQAIRARSTRTSIH